MEDTLRTSQVKEIENLDKCLNPCFNGRYSQSLRYSIKKKHLLVLILVLMEDTFREFKKDYVN